MNYDINVLHDVLCEISDYIFAVCKENNLTCMLVYGTALGAYRHHGFIPWDDDMDLAMPREDYEKFIEIMKTKNDGYSLQNEDTENNYFCGFAKVRKDNTLFMEKSAKGLYEHNGIFVDIFPLDYVSNPANLFYKIKAYYMTYIKHILRFSSCPNVYKQKMGKFRFAVENIISLPAKFISKQKLVKHLHRLMKTCGNKSSKYIAQFDDVIDRQTALSTYYFPVKYLDFSGRQYPAPANIEDYLKNFYGCNYMELPPEENRVTHMPLEVKF